MESKKFGTGLLAILMLLSLSLFVGCGKEKEKTNTPDTSKITDKEETPVKEEEEEEEKVVLLKRNGVEWKENSTIDSSIGAEKYKVVWGDTLSLIARSWNVNTYTLADYNGIKNIDLIEVDQVIYNYTYRK